jgi:hypothetical protein
VHASFGYFSTEPITPDIAEEIYELALPGSKLRSFCADVITVEGPLSGSNRYQSQIEDWSTLIMKGGDFVLDQVERGSFRDVSPSKPYHPMNQAKYINF